MTRVCREFMANGMWKFKDNVSVGTLLQLAEEWLDGPDGGNYQSLSVRRCSRDQYGIWFIYRPHLGSNQKQFFDQITDQLKRKFGNDFVGHDFSQEIWIVK